MTLPRHLASLAAIGALLLVPAQAQVILPGDPGQTGGSGGGGGGVVLPWIPTQGGGSGGGGGVILPWTPTQTAPAGAVRVALRAVLEGAYDTGLPGGALMRTDLEDVLPLAQPYTAAPWGYSGTEAIADVDDDGNGRPDLLDSFDVVDWVLLELRDTATETGARRGAALLLADGSLLDARTALPTGFVRLTPPGDYFLVLTHRSHLAVMTAEPIALSDAVPTAAYDFSADDIYLYGSNASADLGARIALFAGDADGNGSVLADDRQSVWLPAVGQTGYLAADFDLNGSVLADDRQVFLDPNVGRASQVPGAANLTNEEPAAARSSAPRTRSRER